MANDSLGSAAEARDQLNVLGQDANALAAQTQTPWALLVAAGGALAWFVANAAATKPGLAYEPSGMALAPIIVLLVIVHLVQRELGVRFRRLPMRGWLIIGGITAFTLTMFSVALALVSLQLHWWVIAPIVVTWALGTWAAAAFLSSHRQALGRG